MKVSIRAQKLPIRADGAPVPAALADVYYLNSIRNRRHDI
jgi:hypothetical protein